MFFIDYFFKTGLLSIEYRLALLQFSII